MDILSFVIMFAFVLIIAYRFVWLSPKHMAVNSSVKRASDNKKTELEYRKQILQTLSIPVILSGIIVAWIDLNNKQENFRKNQENVLVGQRAERYVKAVEFLSSNELNKQASALYTLEAIAIEDPKRYMQLNIDMICSFIRNQRIKAPVYCFEYMAEITSRFCGYISRKLILRSGHEVPEVLRQYVNTVTPSLYHYRYIREPRYVSVPVIDHSLKALSRMRESLNDDQVRNSLFNQLDYKRHKSGYIFDLSNLNFMGYRFPPGSYRGFIFDNTNLSYSYFTSSQFDKADFSRAYILGAYFTHCDASGVRFISTKAYGALFYNVKMDSAYFKDALFSHSVIGTKTSLADSHILKTDFRDSGFGEADIEGAYIINSSLDDARGLNYNLLKNVNSLIYSSITDEKLVSVLKRNKPELFKMTTEVKKIIENYRNSY